MPCQFAVSSRRISIHALREEGDAVTNVNRTHVKDFYPRPPRGGRQVDRSGRVVTRVFLSTPSARRATSSGAEERGLCVISIHALREEGDTSRL